MESEQRRQFDRFPTSGQAILVLPAEGDGDPAMLTGTLSVISQSGGCLVLKRELPIGTMGVVQLSMGPRTKVIGIEVRSVRYEAEVGTLVGVRFWKHAPTVALSDLMTELRTALDERAA